MRGSQRGDSSKKGELHGTLEDLLPHPLSCSQHHRAPIPAGPGQTLQPSLRAGSLQGSCLRLPLRGWKLHLAHPVLCEFSPGSSNEEKNYPGMLGAGYKLPIVGTFQSTARQGHSFHSMMFRDQSFNLGRFLVSGLWKQTALYKGSSRSPLPLMMMWSQGHEAIVLQRQCIFPPAT